MMYYAAGQFLTETDPDIWYVFSHDGETGQVLDCEDGPMTREEAGTEAMVRNAYQRTNPQHRETA